MIKDYDIKFKKYYKENSYGAITRRQAGVLFRAFKENKLDLDASWLYNNCVDDYAQPTTDRTSKSIATALSMAVSAVFDGEYEFAQKEINSAKQQYDAAYSEVA